MQRTNLPLRVALLILTCGCTQLGSKRQATSIVASSSSSELNHAVQYATEPEPEPLRGSAADLTLATSLARGCKNAGLVQDGRLAELAVAVAKASDGARRPPSYGLVSYHARRAGLAEPTPQVWLASAPDSATLAPALEQAIRDASRTSRLTHCGAGATPLPGGVVVALALSTRPFALVRPIPRQIEAGGAIEIDAQLARGYGRPIMALTDPNGGVTRFSLGDERTFSHAIQAEAAGEYTVELLAEGPEGLTVAAMFPVAVGIPLITSAPALEDEQVEESASEVTERLLALIAEERARRKLPPLRRDPRLTRIAVGHSEDMVDHGFIAHTSHTTGDATARVRHAGLVAYVVLENIGRGYSASELHRGLMESPGHRGNILHPDAREIGIGVVAEREGERLAFIATELFTQLATPMKPRARTAQHAGVQR